MNTLRAERKAKVFIGKINRGIARGVSLASHKKTYQERSILRIVRSITEDPDGMVRYSPRSKKVYLVPKNGAETISLDRANLIIDARKISLNHDFGDALFEMCIDRIENDLKILDDEINKKEKMFFSEEYTKITNGKE